MVENLNPRTFARFGDVYDDAERFSAMLVQARLGEAPEQVAADLREGFVTVPGAGMALDVLDSMMVLCVFVPGDREASAYYLDKPIRIHGGVALQLVAIEEEGTARCYLPEETQLAPCPVPMELPELSLSPSLSVTSVHTLFLQEKPKGFFFRGERHAPYELTYVDRGSLHCIVGGQNYLLRKHELLLCLPNQWHLQYADPDVSAAFMTVSFEMDCPAAAQLGGKVHHATPEMIRCLEGMLAEQRAPGPWSADRILLMLAQVMLELLDTPVRRGEVSPTDTISARNENRLVEHALRYIQAHLSANVTVADVATGVNVSPSYLAVLFRKNLHMTPTEAIRKVKMEEARRLLHQGDLTVTQVAQHLGFATLQHFSRCFKEYFGLGPREYTRSLQV